MFNSFNSLVEYTRDGETEISEDETEKAETAIFPFFN